MLATLASADPLPTWNDGASKRAIIDFVVTTTTPTSASFIPPAERIAVFDNDGTLWGEQPYYYQLAFALDRVRVLAPKHPEWQTEQPFRAALEGDLKTLFGGGEEALLKLVMASHAGNTTEEFDSIVRDWIAKARHPQTGRRYTEMVYQPMLELLGYLRANGYKTFIVSGGGSEFLRAFAENVYGVPPEQIVGSSIVTEYVVVDGKPALVRQPKPNFIDDKSGKPVGIQQHIGRRPVLAFGNSDGDFQMLEWSTAGSGPRLGLLLHHDDALREFAYDRQSVIGRLDKGLDEAPKRGWILVSVQRDWKQVYPVNSNRRN
jgi:phosphoglycolate phosphatase-like HAD superfamily hydrolase